MEVIESKFQGNSPIKYVYRSTSVNNYNDLLANKVSFPNNLQ